MAIVLGVIILMNLAVFASVGIGSALDGNWGPLIALGQAFLWFVAVVAVLSFVGWVIERLGRRA